MPRVPFEISVPANDSASPSLKPYDRFAGGGGRVAVRATSAAADSGKVNMSLLIGSESVQPAGPVFAEASTGRGPDAETPPVLGFGLANDPIDISFANTDAAAVTIRGYMDIENS